MGILYLPVCRSDTWLADKGFKCFNLTSYPEPQSTCAFGPPYDQSKSKTYTVDPNKNFNISYGDGEFLTGTVGFETVTVGGMAVTKQEIGLVTNAAWQGDTVNSGLMGLAYPGLTSVYNGTNPDADKVGSSALYNPVSVPFSSHLLVPGSFPFQFLHSRSRASCDQPL